jgi:molecular chaperone GrpE
MVSAHETPVGEIERDMRQLLREIVDRKAEARERDQTVRGSMRKFLLEMIEVQDAFERVFRKIQAKEGQMTPQMKTWIGNFRTVYKLLDRSLTAQGLTRIEWLEPVFDPEWHTAPETVEDATKADGTIVEEIKSGYIWNGVPLRKAEVKIVRNEN